MPQFSRALDLTQISTPATPAAGHNKLYAKSDRFLYNLDESGAEVRVGKTGAWTADDHGIISWAYDPVIASTGSAVASGTVSLIGLQVPHRATASTIYWHNNAAATLTSGQNAVGLYDAAGNRLANVAIAGTSLTAGFKSHTIGVTINAGFYWVALLFNGSTLPQPIRLATYAAGAINVGLSTAQSRFATNATGQTALPSTITPASNTASALSWWAALG